MPHPQTHEQCSGWMAAVEGAGDPHDSNASSAIEAKKTPNAGAILSVSAAAIYHIPVIVEHVENNPEHYRLSGSGNPGPGTACGKCSILIDPDTDRAGLLYDLLGVFARRRINLTRIESRPSKRGMGKYVVLPRLCRQRVHGRGAPRGRRDNHDPQAGLLPDHRGTRHERYPPPAARHRPHRCRPAVQELHSPGPHRRSARPGTSTILHPLASDDTNLTITALRRSASR